jgi:hypothetical protein
MFLSVRMGDVFVCYSRLVTLLYRMMYILNLRFNAGVKEDALEINLNDASFYTF